MEHLEFIDKDHFEFNYHRKWATGNLSKYIDFCWETDFDTLLKEHPQRFADVLFPNIGYTYLINLGTPFSMQIGKNHFNVKTDGFLPRHTFITCHHSAGNRLFGIKFKVCPIVFEKDVDFSEYKEFIYPLAYLIDRGIVNKLRESESFSDRVKVVFDHYSSLVSNYADSLNYVNVVTTILQTCSQQKTFNIAVNEIAAEHHISMRTLQRYFRATTSYTSKQALNTIRIRQAVLHLTTSPSTFNFIEYGYYDYSHFYKHLSQFVGPGYLPHFSRLVGDAGKGAPAE